MYTEQPYTGTLLESLVASVQKAEAHAAIAFDNQMPVQVEVHATYSYDFTYDNEAVFGVA